MANFKEVTRDEFEAFVAAYPNPLTRGMTTICEPPQLDIMDLKRAPYWPDNLVAKKRGDYYAVIADIDEPVEDDGERDTDEPLFDAKGRQVKVGDTLHVFWGWTMTADGRQDVCRMETAIIRDAGTKYERWSMESCYNNLRSMSFEIIGSVDQPST